MINDKNPLTRLVFTLLLLISVSASALDKVSLQLLWLHQFEFAGFYVAKEKGFYRDVGLEVEINQHRIGLKSDIANNVTQLITLTIFSHANVCFSFYLAILSLKEK